MDDIYGKSQQGDLIRMIELKLPEQSGGFFCY
jgi:hypothetical protein